MSSTVQDFSTAFAARYEAMSDNRIAIGVLFDYTNLPHPVVVATHELVHVTVADVDDLSVWLYERGGEVHVGPEFEGVKTFILHTWTDKRADGSRVAIRVSCSVPLDADVMGEVLAAVAA